MSPGRSRSQAQELIRAGLGALQGIGGAMMVPQVMAIMHVMFPPEQKARAFALAGVVASLGAVTGPLLARYIEPAALAYVRRRNASFRI